MFQPLTPVVKAIIIISTICFAAEAFFGLNTIEIFGLRYFYSQYFNLYQLITHIFVNIRFLDLLSTILAFFTIGQTLEKCFGSKQFLIFCLFTGIGAAILSIIVQHIDVRHTALMYYKYISNPDPANFQEYISHFSNIIYKAYYNFSVSFFENASNSDYIGTSKEIAKYCYILKSNIPTLGPSGVIFGMLIGFSMLFPNTELIMILFPIPIKAKYFAALYGCYELYSILSNSGIENIAHFAHVGGIIFAYIFVKTWQKQDSSH
jgi:membrane associated rhomboid family serine protease